MTATLRSRLRVSEKQADFITGPARYSLFLGGIGAGKTMAGAIKAIPHLQPGTLGFVVAPTFRMLRDATWRASLSIWREAGLAGQILRGDELKVIMRNGAEVLFRSAEDPDRLRGPSVAWAWIDEGALCHPDTWPITIGRLRQDGIMGPAWVTTTPKPTNTGAGARGPNWTYKTFVAEPTPETRVYRAQSIQNPFLPPEYVASLRSQYTARLARQELEAEYLTDVPGALWTFGLFDYRPAPDLVRVVVAIDPAATSSDESDETGIVVAGRGVDGRGYVLADRSCRLSPDGWAQRATAAFDTFAADRLVAEVNNGGDMVEQTLRTVRPTIPYRKIHASRGKHIRAQPVAALYEQGKVSHTQRFEELEAQLTSWTPESGASPDRLDALVYALTELMVGPDRKVEFI